MIQNIQKTERTFIPQSHRKTSAINLENFITENFEIPDNDLERICKFITRDNNLEKIILNLPRMIQSEITYERLLIKFYEEFQEDYLQLEVSIITSIDIAHSLKIEEKLEQKLYELYDLNSADKILLIMDWLVK